MTQPFHLLIAHHHLLFRVLVPYHASLGDITLCDYHNLFHLIKGVTVGRKRQSLKKIHSGNEHKTFALGIVLMSSNIMLVIYFRGEKFSVLKD